MESATRCIRKGAPLRSATQSRPTPYAAILGGTLAMLLACSDPAPGGTGGDAAVSFDASPSDAGIANDAQRDAKAEPPSCAAFAFEASGASCGASCSSVTCSCAGAFPKSVAKCTTDGCLVGVDCKALCGADLGLALACSDTYTVRTTADAGGPPDSGAPLSPNGSSCETGATCASGRCAVLSGSGMCSAGAPSDPCGQADDCVSAICDAQVCSAWTPLRGGTIAQSYALLSELRALPDGYTVAGHGTAVNFGAGPLSSGTMLFLAEFANDGTLRSTVWATTPNLSGTLRGVRLADGTRRLAGDFYTSLQAGNTQLMTTHPEIFDLFAASYGADGSVQWAKRFGTATAQTQRVEALEVDSAGSSYLTGTGDSLDFGAGAVDRSPYLVKLNPDGSLAWAKAFAADNATGQGLAVDPVDGAVVWSGINSGLDDLSLDGSTTTLSGIGIFLARFSAAGEHLWSRGFESFAPSARVAVGPHGEIAMAGSYRQRTSLGGETFANRGGKDIFVARYSPTGEHLWSRSFGGASSDVALSVAVDVDGHVAVGGFFHGTADFGSGPVTAVGDWDGFVARFSPTGELLALRFVQGPGADEVRSVAFHEQGLLVGGIFSGTQDFGSGAVGPGGGFTMVLPR